MVGSYGTVALSFTMLSFLLSCNNKEGDITDPGEPPVEISFDLTRNYQMIKGFGASDAWSAQFVGKNWPEEKRSRIADLLFSLETREDGSPAGIGLSSWRFNIGGGSAEQGPDSQIQDEWRRAECFLNENGEFDWNRQEGQVWFLREAGERGVESFTGFVNSPPVHYTKNNKAWSDDGFSSNLANENYAKYADFLAKVVIGLEELTGVTLNFISPLNEPQWDWKCCGQEGSPWNNSEIAAIVRSIDSTFVANGITSRIEVTDAGQIDYLYESTGNPNRSNQLRTFFDAVSSNYIGDLPSVAPKIAGHSYWTTWDLDWLINSRLMLHQRLNQIDPDLEYWMTEYALLENNEEVTGNGRDLGIDPALYMARIIHSDMVIANASAWEWWLAISPYDYKDGLVYIDYDKNDGNVYESKMLWSLGHYSRFVRPGMKRIETIRTVPVTISGSLSGLMESAYISDTADRLVVVFVNYLAVDKKVKFAGLSGTFSNVSVYQTTASENDNLRLVTSSGINEVINIPKRGIITCLIE